MVTPRVVVLGLDGVPPAVLFDPRVAARMPTVSRLRKRGAWGPLRSVIPPITVPAWACALTGRDPGEIGLYGIRDRVPGTYASFRVATSDRLGSGGIWDLAAQCGLRSTVIAMPPGYPPLHVDGAWIGCMLTPGADKPYTWPPELRGEIEEVVGEYLFDVEQFRQRDRSELIRSVRTMTERRWRLARHLLATAPTELFVLHEIGPDRMHHAFWRAYDSSHPLHVAGAPYAEAIPDYYSYLDGEVAALLELAPDADVVILSDHGARAMIGGIRVNQWLIDNGYMRLRERPPADAVPFSPDMVDWTRTKAWGAGGYYGRVWLSVRDRDPDGIVAPADADALASEIGEGFRAIPDEWGRGIGTVVHRPRDVYRRLEGTPPDLIVYFGDLAWRSVATVGGTGWHTRANDTGPDDANHSVDGVLVLAPASRRVRGIEGAGLLDVYPTIAALLGASVPEGRPGRSLVD